MSHLWISVAIDAEATHRAWAAEVARELREVADRIEGATGATRILVNWPNLEGWAATSPGPT
jgi:hypothetical protein